MALMTTVGLQFLARDRSRTGMASFGRSINNIRRRVMGMASAFLVAAGIGGIGYMIKKQMEAIDTTAKLADRIGMSTENLVALQHAAEITGMETAAMNKAMETFIRRLGEVRMGVGQATYSLEALGLTADDLVTKTPWEALKVVADRMKNLGTSADEAAAASYLFGTRAKEILTLLRQGSKGIEAFRAEADRLGLTFSRFDAAQVEAANDALTRMRDVFTGLFRQIAIQLSPYIEALADKFVDTATAGEGMGKNVVDAFESMSLAAVKLGAIIQIVGIRYKQLSVIALQSTATNLEVLEVLDNFVPILKGMEILFKRKFGVGFGEFAAELHKNAEQWKTDLAELEKATKERGSAIERFYDDLRKKAAGPPAAGEYPMPEMTQRILAMGRKEIEGRLRQKEEMIVQMTAMDVRRIETEEAFGKKMLADEEKRVKDANDIVIEAARGQVEAFRYMDYMTRMERIENLRAYVEANAAALEEVGEAAKILNDEILALERSRMNQMTIYYAELREKMQERGLWLAENLANAMRSIEGSMSNMFYDTMKDAENWADHLEAFFRNVVDAFQRMIADMLAEYMMFKMLTGLGLGHLAPGATPATPTPMPGQAVSPSGALYWPAGSLQHGGSVLRTGLAVVHRGETYSGVGGGKTEIIISYTGRERHEVSAEEFVGTLNETIIQINMQAMEGNIAYQNAMKRAVR